MTCLPEWLPPLLCVSPWSIKTFDLLYSVFTRDFMDSQPAYREHRVWFFPEREDGKELIFWHLTHREDETIGKRLPDLRRCERLPWVRSILDNSEKPEVLDWDYEEGDRSVRTYLWLKELDFLVLLKKYPDGQRRIITSHYVDHAHKRRKLEKKYAGSTKPA